MHWRLYIFIFSFTVSLVFFSLGPLLTTTAQQRGTPTAPSVGVAPKLSDYEKETLKTIKDMTLNLLLLAVGVFALVGGYLSKGRVVVDRRKTLLTSFAFFGVSLIAGLMVFMGLIAQLQAEKFNPNAGLIRGSAAAQIVFLGFGAICFFFFLVGNIKGEEGPPALRKQEGREDD